MTERANVIGVQAYNFVPEGQSSQVSGIKVNILPEKSQNQNGFRGLKVKEWNGDLSLDSAFPVLPANYDLEIDIQANGKVRVIGAKLIK